MSELKATVNDEGGEDFFNTVDDDQKRKDSFALLATYERLTGEKPKM